MQNTGPDSSPRLYLGFDAACATCASIADEVRQATSDRLTPMSLSDSRMIEWRRELLGEDAPWTPTLVVVDDDRTRAFTGVEMGLRLQSELGLKTAWRIAQVLGGRREEITGKGSGRLSRSAFLRGAIGTVFGLSLLSTTASPAAASASNNNGAGDHWISDLKFEGSTQMSDADALAAWQEFTRSDDFRRLASAPSGQSRGLAALNTSLRGVQHTTTGGGVLTALSTQTDTSLVVAYRLQTQSGDTRTMIKLFDRAGDEAMSLRSFIDQGDLFDRESETAAAAAVAARSSCTGSTNCGICLSCQCDGWDLVCITNCCVPCAFACGAVWSCVGCVAIWCPGCATINKCCTRRSCQPRPGCG